MNIWLTKNSEVPVREQLTLQVTLAIAGGDLAAGDRLPSTSEVARRFKIHANTVASAYQHLVDADLLEFRKGSGYFVRDAAVETAGRETRISALVEELFANARGLGLCNTDVVDRVRRYAAARPRRGITLFEPDHDLSEILAFELRDAGFDVSVTQALEKLAPNQLVVAMFDERGRIGSHPSFAGKCIYLRGRSVGSSLSGETRPTETDVIAVVSAWDGFLSMAKIILLASKVEPGNLIVRSTRSDGWETLVRSASLVISDSVTGSKLPDLQQLRVFNLISDSSIDEVRSAIGSI